MPLHTATKAQLRSFTPRTLNDNWYEDRLQQPREGTGVLGTKGRCLPTDQLQSNTRHGLDANPYLTTNALGATRNAMAITKVATRRLVNPANITQQLHCHHPSRPATQPLLTPPPPATSAYREQYQLPKAGTVDRAGRSRYCTAGKLARDTLDVGGLSQGSNGRGKAGGRGELTRHPGESGSAYGVSVFVDQYAAWPERLRGQRVGSVRPCQTVHV